MTTPPDDPRADEGLVERYLFTNGWTMRREVFAPFFWLLFDVERNQVDRDQYRNDLIPRHKLIVKEHVDPDSALAAARSHVRMDDMCWHRWSQWKVTEHGDVTVEGRKVGLWVTQCRVCEKCGKTELDTQTGLL